jgi:hypothetical protein
MEGEGRQERRKRERENRGSAHSFVLNSPFTLSWEGECISPPKERAAGLSFLGQTKICLLVRGDRPGQKVLYSQKESVNLWCWLMTRMKVSWG